MQEKSAGVVIVNNGKYLLLHYEAGHWDFPKGHIEAGETLKQAAIRELNEETGITDIEILPGFLDKIQYILRKKNKLVQKEVAFFAAKTNEKEVKISDEHQDHVWLPFEDALEKLTYDNAKNILKKVHRFLKNEKS